MHDRQLLRQYVDHGSEAAFAALVERHLRQVYATCLRDVRHPQLAEDVAQAVFLILARKARTIRTDASLAGWLFSTARFVSKNALKQEAWRAARERKAAEMQATSTDADAWREIDPVLNDALASLRAPEREVVLMRFFHELSFGETGEALGISEDAAKMRVGRAVEKLRRYMAKAGVAVPTVGFAGLLAENAATAVPTVSVASVTAGTVAAGVGGAGVATIMEGAVKAMWITKVKVAAMAALGLCVVGGTAGVMNHSYGAGAGSPATGRSAAKAVPASVQTVGAAPDLPGASWREHGDPEAVKLLDQMTAAYKGLSSYSGTIEVSGVLGGRPDPSAAGYALLAFQRPNKMAIKPIRDASAAGKPSRERFRQAINDGKYSYFEGPQGSKTYYKRYLIEQLSEVFSSADMITMWGTLLSSSDPFASLFQSNIKEQVTLESLKTAEPVEVDGVPADTVVAVASGGNPGQRYVTTVAFAIGKSDHLLRQVTMTGKDTEGNVIATSTERYIGVRVNPDLPDSTFTFQPNPGDKEIDQTEGAASRQPVPDIPDPMTRPGTAVLTGKVVFENGKPAGGIKVSAQIQDQASLQLAPGQVGRMSERMQRMTWAEDTTGSDGTYRLTKLTDLAYNIAVTDPTDKWVAAAAEGIVGKEGGTVVVPNITLASGGYIAGTVVDKATGKPLAGVGVAGYGPSRPKTTSMSYRAKTDASGHYRLRVAPGSNRVYIGGGYAMTAKEVNVAKGETVTVDFEAVPPGSF
jgi:RNA polymerase sigma factor (sigma-70 family)